MCNCTMSHITLSSIMSGAAGDPPMKLGDPRCMQDYNVEVPCCSNSEDLEKGDELRLHSALLRMEKPRAKRSKTWMHEAQAAEKLRKKSSGR